MKRFIFFVLITSMVAFSCVKQKVRFREPALTNENYSEKATKLYEFYYKKHLSNVLERSEQLQIDKDDRGSVRPRKYSRIVIADLSVKDPNDPSKTIERRNVVICIENYGIKDRAGFNTFDYIMYSKYVYTHGDAKKVVHYKVNNGDTNNMIRVGERFYSEEEEHAFLLSGDKFYNIVKPLFNSTGVKLKSLITKIKNKYSLGKRAEFLIKKLKILKVMTGSMSGEAGVGTAQSVSLHSFALCEVILSENRKIKCVITYLPINISKRLKVGNIYKNVVFRISDEVYLKDVSLGIRRAGDASGEEYSVNTTYERGLEKVLQQEVESTETEQN